MSLTQFQSNNRDFQLMQNSWAAQINPLLSQPLNNGLILKNISLINGTTVVNHLLGRNLQGWFLVDSDAAATIYRSAPKNNLTLTLTSDAALLADIFVF